MTEQVYPEPTIGALIFNKDGKLLLLKSEKFANDYIMLRKKIPTITMGNKFENLIKIISS